MSLLVAHVIYFRYIFFESPKQYYCGKVKVEVFNVIIKSKVIVTGEYVLLHTVQHVD